MALPLFTPPLQPSFQGSSSINGVRQRRTSFGDGYEQRTPDGLNYLPKKHHLVWNNLRQSDSATIVTFLLANAVTGFQYAFPGDSTRQWTITGDINDSPDNANTRRVECDIVEIFDP